MGNADFGSTVSVIGDHILSQAKGADENAPKYLLYDGHSSTRQLVNNTGATVLEDYSYDAYGVMLGGNPGSPSNPDAPATNLLYTGEQFDIDAQQYYLRARYYDPLNGRFNRTDPFAGNQSDPQSLHKYLYCHANPVNGIDPSGKSFGIPEVVVTWAIRVLVAVAVITAVYYTGKWWYHSKRRDYGQYIGPEIGPWLYQSMRKVGNRAAGQDKEFMLSEGGTWVTSGLKTEPPSDAKEVQSVRIFGQVVPSDVGGNIMYGFIGRITNCGLNQLLLVSGIGDRIQKGYRADDPEDVAATTFGWRLADKYMDSDGQSIDWGMLSLEAFWREFLDFEDLSVMTSPVGHLQEHHPPFTLLEQPLK